MPGVASSRYWDAVGPVDAMPIVLIHGAAVSRAMWLPQVEALRSEYRLLLPDLPGHGALSSQRFELDAAVEMISFLVESEAGGRALLVGESLGGYVALATAYSQPRMPVGLVLAGCSVNLTGLRGLLARVSALFAREVASRLLGEGRMVKATEAFLHRRYPADIVDALVRGGLNPRSRADALLELAGKDFAAMLRTVPCAVLILNGEKDRVNRRGEYRFLANSSRGRLETLPGAGHTASLDAPDAFNQAMRRFARSLHW